MTEKTQIIGCPRYDTAQDTRARGRGIAVLWLLLWLPAVAAAQDEEFTASFRFQDCSFQSTGENPYFIELDPGHRLVFEAEEDGVTTELFITVLPATRRISLRLGGRIRTVTTRVVEEREFEDGDLIEVSRNFLAICGGTNDVVYFGEEVDIYEDGEIVRHE
jgi:hypothetical protein